MESRREERVFQLLQMLNLLLSKQKACNRYRYRPLVFAVVSCRCYVGYDFLTISLHILALQFPTLLSPKGATSSYD